MKATIELDKALLDKAIAKRIADLERENAKLNARVKRRDEQITRMRQGLDLSKQTREAIQEAANRLLNLLTQANWAEWDSGD